MSSDMEHKKRDLADAPSILDRLCVIIPTYNNEKTLLDVVARTYNYSKNIIVVNDGSTDSTLELLHTCQTPLTLVSYNVNRGKGHALIEGFKKARELGYDYAITIDSDGQHYPEDIPLFVEAEEKNLGSFIIGSRTLENKDISKGSLFANKFSNFWFFIQTGISLPDTQTGYRLYPLKKLKWTSLVTSRYESELELLVFPAWHGARMVPIDVNVFYPTREERVSHFRPGLDFFRISILNTVLCFGALLYALPRKLLLFIRTVWYTLFSFLFFLTGVSLLTLFCLLYFNIGRDSHKKRYTLHKILYRLSGFISRNIPGVKFTLSNPHNVDFSKPKVLICNHQSHLDLMFTMMLTPNLVILTNNWVWNNQFYGKIIKYAEFYPVTEGVDSSLEHIESLVNRGYSVLVFPEGSRSADCRIQRFHKGAFYISELLKLDIVPIFLYGAGLVLPKKLFYLRKGKVHVEVHAPIRWNDMEMGENFKKRTRAYERYYKREFKRISIEQV